MKSFGLKLVGLLLLGIFLVSGFWLANKWQIGGGTEMQKNVTPLKQSAAEVERKVENIPAEKEAVQQRSDAQDASLSQAVLLKVPFTSQAPTGNWQEEVFQDGCEEASAMMAMAWAKGVTLGAPTEVENEIRKLTAFEKNMLGDVIDASVEDMARVMRAYYKYEKIEVKKNISVADIKTELAKGNLVVVPAAGQDLGNPNYTAPGPVTHMLVVVGYDEKRQEFITNDPGTKRGEGYRYKQQVLGDAIWAYPTAQEHASVPTLAERSKVMLVVTK